VSVHVHVQVSSTLDAALEVPALPLDGESPCCPTWTHPSDLVRNVEEGVYCEWARWELFGVVLVVEAGCMDRISIRLFGNERGGGDTPLIIDHPFTNSRLDVVDVLLADLELKTQIEYSNEGAEMFVITLFRKAILKNGGGNEQRPHRPCQRREI